MSGSTPSVSRPCAPIGDGAKDDPLLIADLSHGLNDEDDACVTVESVGHGSFLVVKGANTVETPGLDVIFEKDGKRYVAQLTLYAVHELEDAPSTEPASEVNHVERGWYVEGDHPAATPLGPWLYCGDSLWVLESVLNNPDKSQVTALFRAANARRQELAGSKDD